MKKKRRQSVPGIRVAAVAVTAVLFLLLPAPRIETRELMKIPLFIKDREIRVEVARTPEERAQGLMGRERLGKDDGMLFIFEVEDRHGFWMKNTLIPLSIAFIDREGRIVRITDMMPLTLDSHDPPRPVLFALEMNRGWFKTNGIREGDVVRFSK
jgi:uncharacterized membrane protein (UPF0127 family)